ncbi:MAG: hypothetical protein NVSMB2_09050 [Chloroflexota bacterium]
MSMRAIPLIVIASASAVRAENIAAPLRQDGNLVYVTHSAEGCLRVATSVTPDVVVLDPALPPRLERLLHAHPASAKAQILHMTDEPAFSSRTSGNKAILHAA